MRPETTLHSEAEYIFADCSRHNQFLLHFIGGPYRCRIHQNPHELFGSIRGSVLIGEVRPQESPYWAELDDS